MLSLGAILERCYKSGDCLIWTGALNSDGYPRAGIKGNSNIKLHRHVCGMFHDISGLVVRHTCDNPRCLNPEHLTPGSVVDNVRDMDERGRRFRLLTDAKAKEIVDLLDECLSNKEIAELTGVDPRRVSEIRTGRRDIKGKLVKP